MWRRHDAVASGSAVATSRVRKPHCWYVCRKQLQVCGREYWSVDGQVDGWDGDSRFFSMGARAKGLEMDGGHVLWLDCRVDVENFGYASGVFPNRAWSGCCRYWKAGSSGIAWLLDGGVV